MILPARNPPAPMKISAQQFEALVMEQMDMLYRVARRMTRDAHKAEDLVQETFLRAFKSAEGFDLQEYGVRPWLMRIMHNLHVSRGMREKRQPAAMADEHLEAAAAESAPLPAALLDGVDDRLKHAFDALPEEYQAVMHLWAIEEFSYKEIADALEIPVGTVMSRLHRARGRLSEQLREYALREGIIRE